MQVAVEKIGAVIGPGGRVIQGARDTSGAESINVSSALLCDSLYLHSCHRGPLVHGCYVQLLERSRVAPCVGCVTWFGAVVDGAFRRGAD